VRKNSLLEYTICTKWVFGDKGFHSLITLPVLAINELSIPRSKVVLSPQLYNLHRQLQFRESVRFYEADDVRSRNTPEQQSVIFSISANSRICMPALRTLWSGEVKMLNLKVVLEKRDKMQISRFWLA
jgi:hypothetical protein